MLDITTPTQCAMIKSDNGIGMTLFDFTDGYWEGSIQVHVCKPAHSNDDDGAKKPPPHVDDERHVSQNDNGQNDNGQNDNGQNNGKVSTDTTGTHSKTSKDTDTSSAYASKNSETSTSTSVCKTLSSSIRFYYVTAFDPVIHVLLPLDGYVYGRHDRPVIVTHIVDVTDIGTALMGLYVRVEINGTVVGQVCVFMYVCVCVDVNDKGTALMGLYVRVEINGTVVGQVCMYVCVYVCGCE